MNKNRKTSHILNVFQYDETTGAVTLPSTLVLTAPASNDNSTKVGTTAWVRTYVTGLSYLTGNQSITVSGDATGSGTTGITLTLANTAVTPGVYGSATLVPVVTVDSKGRVTSVTTAAISGSLTFTGDVTGSGTTGTSTGLTLAASGVTAGTYTKVTVDTKGRVTVGASATTSDISEGTNLYYTDTRVGTYLTANSYATQSYVTTQVSNLVAAAPATLDTLNELAAALGNDPSFATTVSTSIGTKVPQTRTLTINGTAYDLSADRAWTITSMIYPGAGISISTGTGWGTSITDNSANWNTAYGWGNHASGGYLTSATAATTYASLTGAYANPAFVASLAYSKITGVPAFLTSYTETDPYRVTSVAVSGTSTKTITLTRADTSTVTTTWTDIDTDTNTYVTSAGFSGGTLTLTRNDAGTVTVSLDGRYYLATNPSSYITSSSLTSYVPYTGATANIDTGGYSITAGAVTLTSNLWLKNIGTYDFIMSNATSVTTNTIRAYYNTSDELRFYAKNTAGGSVVPKIMVGDGTTFYTLYHSANIPTWNQNTTGTAASISGFNNPTTAATANTIAYRDGSGDLYARYFLGGYINTSDNVDTGTITYIMAKFGDNYHRSATAAKVQSFLGLGSLAYSSATIPTNNNQLTNGAGYITSSANISGYASYLPTAYVGGQQTNPQVYFNNGIGLKAAMTGAWSVWSDTLWINGYSGGDVKQMCALHTLRNGTPRMAISVQAHDATAYGTFYEFITSYNIASQSVSYATTAGSAPNASNANTEYLVTPATGNGLKFWSSDNYKISMGASALYYYGPVTDYSIKTQMNDGDTGRGFTWGRISYAPIAAINSTSGNMQIAGTFTSTAHYITGSTNGGYIYSNDWGIKMANSNGYIQFGPANGSWSHIYSDKSFYFNQELYVNGQIVIHSGSIGSQSVSNATTATNFNNGSAYSSGGVVYVDTLESINTNDWLELTYYGGVGVRIGTGVNGSKALYAGSLYDAGNRVYSAGNPQVNISGNAATATSAGTVTGSSTIGGYLTLNTNWGVSPYTAAFNIVGTHPSMVFRGSNADTHYLIHMDSAGDIQYYFGPGYTTNNWTQRYTFTKGGNFSALTGNISASGTISASNFSGSHSGSSSGTNTGDQTNISGNAATATNSSQLNGISSTQIFNNMGNTHGTYQDFNSVGNFGVRYMQGATNAPQSGQFYGFTLGLGNDYAIGTYGSQFYWLRNTTNPYIWIRYQEGGSWGAWTKTSAGYADNAGNTNSVSNATGGTYTWTGAQNNFTGNGNTGGTNNVGMIIYSTGGNGSQFSFHRAGYYAINMGLDSDNVIRIGGWSASPNRFQMDMSGNLTMSGDVTAYSDARVKENIATIENALDKVLALRGVSYNRIDSDDKKTKIGVIAQETLPIVPEVVNQDNDGMYNVSYGNLAGLFIEAIKEQQKEIEELKTLIYGITR